ncbi:MAG: hypothetical protein JWQ96_2685 [Segetibacter sp.]|nr:hypothetical protein [Segetibacter sp.]
MKKLLLVLAIGAFAACNNGETTTTTSDSLSQDSINNATTTPALGDTLSTGTGGGL